MFKIDKPWGGLEVGLESEYHLAPSCESGRQRDQGGRVRAEP